MRSQFSLLTIALLTVSLPGCGDDEADPVSESSPATTAGPGSPATATRHESPTAAFKAMQQAIGRQDFEQASRCLTEESQVQTIAGMVIASAFMLAFDPDEQKQKEHAEILERHGLDPSADADPPPEGGPEQAMKLLADQIADKPAFMGELMQWLLSNSDDQTESGFGAIAQASLEELSIDGHSATAQVRKANDETRPIEFVKVDGGWLVSLSREPMMSLNGEGIDFSDSGGFDGWADSGDDVEVTEGISRQQFDAAWRHSIIVGNRPAGELLKDLASQCGLDWKPGEGTADALAKPVSLAEDRTSRLHTIEAACREVGLHPVYSLRSLRVEPGLRTTAVGFAGPFLIEVGKITADPETATANMTLRVVAAGLPTSVIAQLDNDCTVAVDEIAGPTGESLSQDGHPGFPFASVTSRMLLMEVPVKLKGLLRNVTEIPELTGSISGALPLTVRLLEFDSLQAGATVSADDVTVTLKSVDAGPKFQLEVDGADSGGLEFIAKNGEKIIQPSASFGGGSFMQLSFSQPVTSLAVRAVTRSEPLKYAFKLSRIALPDAARMPEKNAELDVQGDSPVTYEFLNIGDKDGDRVIFFKVTNHTNKKIDQLVVDMSYQDADGKEIKSVPHTSNGGFGIPAPGTEMPLTQSGFFLTPDTATVHATPTFIRFVDGTEWDQPWKLSAADAPYVEGTGTLKLTGEAFLTTGHVGISTDGKPQFGLAGIGGVSASTNRTSAGSRSSNLHIASGTRCRFRHFRMESGTHFVFLRRGDHFLVGQWLTVEPKMQKQLELIVDQSQAVRLEVTPPPGGEKTTRVHLLPLPAEGAVPLENAQLRQLAFSLNARAPVENGVAVFAEVAPGRYLIVASSASELINVRAGETNKVVLSSE